MGKKNRIYEYDDEEDVVIDKKTKRRLERARNRELQQQQRPEESGEPEVEVEEVGTDVMSQLALLCQENRWREAVLQARSALAEAESEGHEEMVAPLSMALAKIEMSWRRQMASAFMDKAKEMLKKEYLLDVGEQ